MEPRLFSIISADGTELDLNGPAVFAYSPTGLGISLKNDILQRDNMLYINTRELNLDSIELSLVFSDYSELTPYENFLYFAKKLTGGICKLKYIVPKVGEYYRDVVVKKMTKTDYNQKNGLDEKITFEPVSLWYQMLEFKNLEGTSVEQEISFDLESTNIVPLHYKNELLLLNLEPDPDESASSDLSYISNPYVYCSNDYTHPGQDGYSVEIPNIHQMGYEGNIINTVHALRMGNLKGMSYASYDVFKIDDETYDSDNEKLLSAFDPDKTISTSTCLNKEHRNCKIPLCVTDGSNTITIPSYGVKTGYIFRVKMETSLI